jgi:hypothetical protein
MAVIIAILFFRRHFAAVNVGFLLVAKVIPLIIMLVIEKEAYNTDPVPVAVLFIIYVIYLHLNARTVMYMYGLEKLYK